MKQMTRRTGATDFLIDQNRAITLNLQSVATSASGNKARICQRGGIALSIRKTVRIMLHNAM
jgi:hypothetical protein